MMIRGLLAIGYKGVTLVLGSILWPWGRTQQSYADFSYSLKRCPGMSQTSGSSRNVTNL